MQEIVIGNRSYKVEQSRENGEIIVNGKIKSFDLIKVGERHYHLLLDGDSMKVEIVEHDKKQPAIKINGEFYRPEVKDETDLLLERLGMNITAKKAVKELKAPMPGLVLDIRVEAGQSVEEGDPLIVLEAMKMENVLKAPAASVVKSIAVSKGDAIDKNALLIAFE